METKLFNQNFIFLIIGQTASMFGTITAISYLPPVFLSPVAGILADRKNKRNLMVALDGIYCITAILLAISMSLPNELIYIMVVMVILSIISSFETPVVQ